jgi:hypothetical protein
MIAKDCAIILVDERPQHIVMRQFRPEVLLTVDVPKVSNPFQNLMYLPIMG